MAVLLACAHFIQYTLMNIATEQKASNTILLKWQYKFDVLKYANY
jgi:hypothetical protein